MVKNINKKRPDPTLMDDLINGKHSQLINRRVHEKVVMAAKRSRNYVFDDEATKRVGEICRTMSDVIADNSTFARMPFEKTFVELNAPALFESILGYKNTADLQDERIGFMFDENDVYTVASRGGEKGASITPIVYHLHSESTPEEELEMCRVLGLSRMQIDAFYWGAAYSTLSVNHQRKLRAEHSTSFALDTKQKPNGFFHRMINQGGAGDLRVILCLALILTRPASLRVTGGRHETERYMTSKGVRPFFAHNVVTIKLNPEQLLKRSIDKARVQYAKKRLHDVRGTWCQTHKSRTNNCDHRWVETDKDHYYCSKCYGRRWWRKEHQRGDVSVGVVRKHYSVKP